MESKDTRINKLRGEISRRNAEISACDAENRNAKSIYDRSCYPDFLREKVNIMQAELDDLTGPKGSSSGYSAFV